MEIYIGADYRGLEQKKELIDDLALDFDVTDMGAYEYHEGDDFNDPAVAVAKAVRENEPAFGILICDSAHGMTMQANRFKRIRAAHCDSVESAKLAREHDDANILCTSAHSVDGDSMSQIARAFIDTEFTPLERRVRRINRLDEREDYA